MMIIDHSVNRTQIARCSRNRLL